MNQPFFVLLIVALTAHLLAEEDKKPLRLSPQEILMLDDFLKLKPGLTEDELRERVPELSITYKNKDTRKLTATTSTFRLAGMEWRGFITLMDGRVQKAVLYATARKESDPRATAQAIPQYKVRAIGLLIAAHYASKFGKVSEGYVPNLDCPAGNPFGLRQQWRLKNSALAVEFSKNSSTSSLEILFADWTAWDKEERATYGSENSWPLKPAPQKLLLEASSH